MGIQFIDFDNGDSLQLTGHAEILWDDRSLPGEQASHVGSCKLRSTLHKTQAGVQIGSSTTTDLLQTDALSFWGAMT